MTTKKITAFAATAAVAVGGLVPAVGAAKATHEGKYSVNKQVYVYHHAGVGFDGTVFKGNTVKVERLSPSGKWAYGMVYGHVNRHAWIDASALTLKK
jgi:hypothetical protein